MNIIEKLATAIAQEPSTELEGICRHAVAIEMRNAKRMLTAEEIEDVVDEVVDEEAIADLEDRYEDGEVEVSDAERGNIPEEDIVTMQDEDGEVVEGVVVEGKFARLVIVPDVSKRTISASIANHSDMLAHMANMNEGINLKSLYHPVPDVNMPCPACASRNVTPVWYDSGQVVACCNDCDMEFDASINDVAHATLAERTVEDIDILPEHEVFGSVWLSGDGFGYEIYASGELIDSGEEDDYEDVIERFDDIADAYDDIEEGTQVDFSNGDSDIIEMMADDDVFFGAGRKASRIRLARMVADKRAYLDNSNRVDMRVEAGMCFDTSDGAIIVESVRSDGIYASVIGPQPDGRIGERVVRFSQKELADAVGR